MPWLQPSIPWQGSTALSAHASREGARQAEKRAASQTVRLLELYAQYGPLTDADAARHLGVERTSINARRVPLVTRGIVVAVDTVPSTRGGGRNTRWGLKQA